MIKFKLAILSVFIVPFFSGCFPGADLIGEYEKDVSNRPQLWGGYSKGERYVLLHDIFLEEEEFPMKMRKYAAAVPKNLTGGNYFLHYGGPDTIQEFLEKKEQWPEIIGIIKAGTQIECTKVLGWGTLTWPMSHGVYATILDGPYAGKLIAITDLSYIDNPTNDKDLFVPYPNYSLLKKVSADE